MKDQVWKTIKSGSNHMQMMPEIKDSPSEM